MVKKIFSTLGVVVGILGCGGATTGGNPLRAPAAVTPPERTPPAPEESRVPVEEIPIVRTLKNHGIEVEMDWRAIESSRQGRPAGGPTLEEVLKVFWQELADNEAAILERKSQFTKIVITIYTNYRSIQNRKVWFLNYETRRGQLAGYFSLFEKINQYSAHFNIDFNFDHSGGPGESHPYRPLREMVAVIEKYGRELEETKGLFKEIELDTFSKYYPISRTLTLSRKRVKSDFVRFMRNLKPLGPVYNWGAQNKVEIEADFNLRQESQKVYFAFEILNKSLPSLDLLTKAGMLDEITLYLYETEVDYYSTLKDLSLGIVPENQDAVMRALKNLGSVARISLDLQRSIEVESSELNGEFEVVVALLERLWPRLKAKVSKIKKIILTVSASSYLSDRQELRIGSWSSLRETESIILAIK